MWSEETKYTRIGNSPFFILGVIAVGLIIVMGCAFSILALKLLKGPLPTSTQDNQTAAIPAVLPTSYYSIRLPVILSESVPVPVPVSGSVTVSVTESIWKVMKIKKLGYEMDGRRYDLAIFKRVDSEETVKTYCIDRGRDTPDIGTEYVLNTDGVFVPLSENDAHPLQRFQMIQ